VWRWPGIARVKIPIDGVIVGEFFGFLQGFGMGGPENRQQVRG
jgi:hypothetical protein